MLNQKSAGYHQQQPFASPGQPRSPPRAPRPGAERCIGAQPGKRSVGLLCRDPRAVCEAAVQGRGASVLRAPQPRGASWAYAAWTSLPISGRRVVGEAGGKQKAIKAIFGGGFPLFLSLPSSFEEGWGEQGRQRQENSPGRGE